MLGGLVRGRKVKKIGEGYQLREPSVPYGGHFEVEKGDIGPENTYFWSDSRCISLGPTPIKYQIVYEPQLDVCCLNCTSLRESQDSFE